MSNLSRALVLILVIVAVSTGVYFLMERNNDGAFEKAGEKVDQAIQDATGRN